jgi:hypothetical protein
MLDASDFTRNTVACDNECYKRDSPYPQPMKKIEKGWPRSYISDLLRI